MNLTVKPITSEDLWTTFFNDCGSPSFHHSWEWGELQVSLGHDILRLGLYDGSNLQAIALVIKHKARRGNFLFIPHGPVSKSFDFKVLEKNLSTLTDYLQILAQRENFTFIRIAPIVHDTPEHRLLFRNLSFRQAPIYIHAERMWALDITKSEEDLLAHMRKTTRYLIRRADKDGITVSKTTTGDSVDRFWDIYKETFTRENFSPYSKQFITKEFESFRKKNNALFLFGLLQQDKNSNTPKFAQEGPSPTSTSTFAGALILFTKSTAFYHQGASIHSRFPVPYVLQWEAIKEAKKRGCTVYNFYGILQEGRTPKAWKGLTQFKQGFGGYQIDYLPTQDLILSPKYYLTYAYERFLNIKRGV